MMLIDTSALFTNNYRNQLKSLRVTYKQLKSTIESFKLVIFLIRLEISYWICTLP